MDDTRGVLSLILGGGAGTRLYPLTRMRAKPAVPIGGKYRLIDIPISNCINAGLNRIDLLTQFNSVSLHRHITRAYRFDDFSEGAVQILAAEQTPRHAEWFQGNADAVRKHMSELKVSGARDLLILSGDHLYRMDYRPFIAAHRRANADITLAVKPVSRAEAPRYGVVALGPGDEVQAFHEKPSDPALLDGLASGRDEALPLLASMGVYVFRAEALYRLLTSSDGPDFGKDILPTNLGKCRMQGYRFGGYWQDIGTIGAFFEANLMLASQAPPFTFSAPDWPYYTEPTFHPPTVLGGGSDLRDVMLSDGCTIASASIHRAVLGPGSDVASGAVLRDVVMMGSRRAPKHRARSEAHDDGGVPVGVGRGARLERVILDKGARVGEGVHIRALPGRPPVETEHYAVRDGVVVVMKNGVIPPGTVI